MRRITVVVLLILCAGAFLFLGGCDMEMDSAFLEAIQERIAEDVEEAGLIPTYSVIYDGNGHTGGLVPVDSTAYKEGDTATVLGNTNGLTKTGYSFAGWNTETDGNGMAYVANDTINIGTVNVTLFAQWTINPTYTVTYDGNGNDGGAEPTDETNYTEGQSVTVKGQGTLTLSGSTFTGWNTQNNGEGTEYTVGSSFPMPDNDVVLWAQWTTNPTYTVTYFGTGSDSGTAPVDMNNYETSTIVTVKLPGDLAKIGYDFVNWNTQPNGGGTPRTPESTFEMGTADIELHSQWEPSSYTVTFNKQGGDGGSNSVTAVFDFVMPEATAPTRTGYAFGGYYTEIIGGGIQYYTSGMNSARSWDIPSNKTLYAKWTGLSFTVSFDGEGGATPTPNSKSVTFGSPYGTLATTTRAGYIFDGWWTGDNGTGTEAKAATTVSIANNHTLHAKWWDWTLTQQTYTAGGITFKMSQVPGGHTFPIGTNDSSTATVNNTYWIGETEVTFELYETVYQWAISNGYTFAYHGTGAGGTSTGVDQTPVGYITWRDAMIWCNALTEWYNVQRGTSLACVYHTNSSYSTPIRAVTTSTSLDTTAGHQDNPYVNSNANGFRLLSANEWELAARWRADNINVVSSYSSPWFTKGNSASGASAYFFDDETATYAVAWFSENSSTTQEVKTKTPNSLGLYDMSGNAGEFCFDWSDSTQRHLRGGDYTQLGNQVSIGQYFTHKTFPYHRLQKYGFRLGKNN